MKKADLRGRPPPKNSPADMIRVIHSLTSSKAHTTPPLTTPPITEIACIICLGWLLRPLELSCGNLVCSECCCMWIRIGDTTSCPCCYAHQLNEDTITTPSRVTEQLLHHHMNSCQAVGLSPSHTTIGEILSKSTHTPTTPVEKRVAENLIKRMLSEEDSNIIKVPTRGQVG